MVQAVQGQFAAGLTVGAVFIGRDSLAAQAAEALGLANGLPTGGAGLSDLPEEGPKNQAQRPSSLAGMRACFLRGEAEIDDPGTEEGFQLVQDLAGALAEAAAFGIKTAGPQWKVLS